MENLLAALITGIQSGTLRVIDLTQTLNHGTPVISLPPQWAQTPPFRLRELSRYNEQGPFWYWNALRDGRAYRHAPGRPLPLGYGARSGNR